MKKHLLPAAIALCLLPSAFLHAQLNYTQVTSSGLTAVTFEMGPAELELGDMDGDGDVDIVSVGDHGSPNVNASEGGVMVWKNNGTGASWTLSKSGAFGYGGVAIGDVNNDGKMDVGYSVHHNYSGVDFGDQLIEVALGNGSASSWTPYDDGLATNGETYGMFGTDFADVNNDGLLDIASNSFGCCSGLHIYKNNGNGTWTQTDGANGGNSGEWLKFGDFNNDGKVDLFSATELGFAWTNDGTGFFTLKDNGITTDWIIHLDVADANNDGAKDLAIIDTAYAAKVFYFNKNLNAWASMSNGLPTSGCNNISICDMDMDGNADVIVFKNKLIEIYKGDGFGNWSLAGSFAVPENEFNAVTTGDLDHDGYSDIIFLARDYSSSMNDNHLRVYLHNAVAHGINILPVNPKGFECFAPGSVQFVSWISSVPTGPNATVSIEVSSAGTAGPWTSVVANAPNSGVYQWIVPALNSSTCYLKYTISNGTNNATVTMSNAFGIGTCVASPTSVEDQNQNVTGFSVYPNPMSTQGYIHFNLEKQAPVKIQIVDVLGKVVVTLMDETLSAGFQNPRIPVEQLQSGIYFCRLSANGAVSNQKIVVTK